MMKLACTHHNPETGYTYEFTDSHGTVEFTISEEGLKTLCEAKNIDQMMVMPEPVNIGTVRNMIAAYAVHSLSMFKPGNQPLVGRTLTLE